MQNPNYTTCQQIIKKRASSNIQRIKVSLLFIFVVLAFGVYEST